MSQSVEIRKYTGAGCGPTRNVTVETLCPVTLEVKHQRGSPPFVSLSNISFVCTRCAVLSEPQPRAAGAAEASAQSGGIAQVFVRASQGVVVVAEGCSFTTDMGVCTPVSSESLTETVLSSLCRRG